LDSSRNDYADSEITQAKTLDETELIGMKRTEVEAVTGLSGVSKGFWYDYGPTLSLAFNREVVVRVKMILPRAYTDCTEAGRDLGFEGAGPSNSGVDGVSHCVLENRSDNRHDVAIHGKLRGKVLNMRPYSRGRCGNRLFR